MHGKCPLGGNKQLGTHYFETQACGCTWWGNRKYCLDCAKYVHTNYRDRFE